MNYLLLYVHLKVAPTQFGFNDQGTVQISQKQKNPTLLHFDS